MNHKHKLFYNKINSYSDYSKQTNQNKPENANKQNPKI